MLRACLLPCVVTLALAPAALLGGGTILIAYWPFHLPLPAAVVLAVIPVLAVFIGELWLGAYLLGPRFDRLDISAELRP